MSEYSLSVDDQALHAVLLSDDIGWPDIIAERNREMYITHRKTNISNSDSSQCFISIFWGSGGHFVNKVHQGNTLQNSYHWASSTTINLVNYLVMKIKIINKGCQSTAVYMPWDYSYVNPVRSRSAKTFADFDIFSSASPSQYFQYGRQVLLWSFSSFEGGSLGG